MTRRVVPTRRNVVGHSTLDGPVRWSAVVQPDRRQDYGEERLKAIGNVRGAILVCIYTDRVQTGQLTRRIISLRAASRKERNAYREAFAK